jgi:hypothetical protein
VSRSITARRLAAGLFALGLLASLPMQARAHAEVVESNPAANAALIEAPDALTITFSFAGGGDIRVTVECIEAVFADVSRPWPTPRKPAHEL